MSPENRAVLETELDALRRFLHQNPEFELLRAPLADAKALAEAPELDIELVRAAQRLLRLIPDHDVTPVLALLASGLRSAFEIAEMSSTEFTERHGAALADDAATIVEVHRRARVVRARVHLLYVQAQQQREPNLPLSLAPARRRS